MLIECRSTFHFNIHVCMSMQVTTYLPQSARNVDLRHDYVQIMNSECNKAVQKNILGHVFYSLRKQLTFRDDTITGFRTK